MADTPALTRLNELLSREVELLRRYQYAVKQTEEAKRVELDLARQLHDAQMNLQGVGFANDAFKEAQANASTSVDAKPKPSDKTRLTPSDN